MPLSEPQHCIVSAPQRFKVVIAGRRFGKTHLSIRFLCKAARLPEREVWYVAPTYKQAKMIVFKKLRKKLQDLRWVSKINETNLSFELKNGSTISLKGADNYDSLRGVGLDFLVMDEFADIDQEAWTETLRPTLADKMGSALFIGTPKGMNWAKDLYDMAELYPDEWASFQYTTEQGGNVPLSEIDAARRSLDARTFNQEFRATFETFSGRIFYAFDRKVNVNPYTDPLPKELHLGVDFNIDPMSATIAVKNGNILHVIDEFKIFGSNTEELVEEVKTRYPEHTIIAYPDPAGAQRKTSAGGRTDHTILRNAGFTVKAPHSHNAVRDGINAVNAKLCSSSGVTTLYIDPRCKYVIECLEKHIYKEGTSIPEKGGNPDFSHMNDALRYKVDYLFPIRQPTVPLPVRHWGHKLG
jgi:hypothetical protein